MHLSLYLAALLALLTVSLGLGLSVLSGLTTAARWHVLFALGVLPLMLAAILYFVPVLTRRAPVAGPVQLLPWLAWLAGAAVVLGIARYPDLRLSAAITAGLIVLLMLLWIIQQSRGGLSAPHAGVYWYGAALLCLLLALVAIAVAIVWPAHWPALRRLHLHLNLLGFIGLAAWGTLRVLLPTARGTPDPEAAGVLRRAWPLALAGSVLIAVGAAWMPSLAVPGVVLWLWPAVAWLIAMRRRGEPAWQGWHAPGSALWWAACAWVLLLLLGAWHGWAGGDSQALLALFVVAFLCPLLLGASCQLLPVWRWPGASHAALQALRTRLARGIGLRSLLLVGAAVLVVTGLREGLYLAGLVMLSHVAQVMWVLRVDRAITSDDKRAKV